MEIQIAPHTLERAEERGVNEAEIRDVLLTGFFCSREARSIGEG